MNRDNFKHTSYTPRPTVATSGRESRTTPTPAVRSVNQPTTPTVKSHLTPSRRLLEGVKQLSMAKWTKRNKAQITKLTNYNKKHRLGMRIGTASMAILTLGILIHQAVDSKQTLDKYDLSIVQSRLLTKPIPIYASKLSQSKETGDITYNANFQKSDVLSSVGQSGQPKFQASFAAGSSKEVTVTDAINDISISFTPKFAVNEPQKRDNRVIYPIMGKNASKVYTLGGSVVKEDIIVHEFSGDTMQFRYDVKLPDGTEMRMEKDGSIGIYGVDTKLLGNVTTGSDKDAEILQNARQNGKKQTLLFRIPAPYILEGRKTISKAQTWYEIDGNKLTVYASDLRSANYPISIDPSIYVETAAKLMKGNNETNIDFDVTNELIQKSQTTGARIDSFQGNLDMSQGVWDHATASAGGYIYRTGGRTGAAAKPQVVDQQRTLLASGSTYTMSMPATRPAGDLYIAIMCHDGSDGGSITYDNSWTEFADLQGLSAFWKIGDDVSGGNEASSYDFGGYGSEEWAGVIMRITNFDTNDPVSPTPTTTSAGSGTPTFPAITPDNDSTLIVRGAGWDQDDPSNTGWVPSGHTKIDSESSSNGGNGSCGFAAASVDNPPAGGVSTGTASFADASVSDDYGATSIAINPIPSTPTTQTTVDWAKFNSSTLAIESPNPGDGVCDGWCNESVYNLPSARRGHSMVAYNGYLYVIGGVDGSGSRVSTVLIAKLGANGEPQLWHPTDNDKSNWDYWFTDTGLNGGTARSYLAAYAYNNKMYVLGGQTNASTGGVTTVEAADILPNGKLGTWTTSGMQALPAARHNFTVHVYNDVMYIVGGFEGAMTSSANLRATVYYSKLTSTGTMNSWTATTSFTTARATYGGSFSTVWGAYLYVAGGCTAVDGSGDCTTIASDIQLASINADGTISEFNTIIGITNQRIGYSLTAWQGGLYRIGGCSEQNASTSECTSTLADVDYGVVNPDGDASTVNESTNTSTAPCSTSNYSCNLPGTTYIGNMANAAAIVNGYLYIIGGCTNNVCSSTSANVAYQSIGSDGSLNRPATCPGGTYRGNAYCVDSTNTISGGIAAAAVAVFNGTIYLVGGTSGSALKGNVYRNTVNNDGSLAGTWTAQTTGSIGATSVKYSYAYARANPSSAGSNPGNLYIFGGCTGGGAELGCSSYTGNVYKCDISTSGAITGSSCTTSGQLQIGTLSGASGAGLGAHAGTVYANYVYLVGGLAPGLTDLTSVRYAEIDNSNNIVTVGSGWVQSTNTTSVGRRRAAAFGYNGYLYVVGGFNQTSGVLDDIQFAKVNVSTGDIEPFDTSGVNINQRWALTVPVSNSYAYVIGGCTDGDSPGGCNTRTDVVQTFQMYNNDSGAIRNMTAGNTLGVDRVGGSVTVMNGYIYYAGGCTAMNCSTLTNTTYYASIDANGVVGSWSAGGNLPASLAWGKLVNAGGTLYYVGGQTGSATTTAVSSVYYTSGISSGNPTWNGSAATKGIGDTGSGGQARTQFGAAVWDNMLFVTGGFNASGTAQTTVYASPLLDGGGNITSNWTSTTASNVARGGHTTVAYANNLYILGGWDGTNYLSDTQYTQINLNSTTKRPDGTVDSWTYSTSLPNAIRDADGFVANGYMYLFGGRTATTTCAPNVNIAPISANTTIASGNNPTGVGEWYETNVRYTGDRYGAAVAYSGGRSYLIGGGCSSFVSSGDRMYYSTLKSQPQVAKYSRMIDTDTDVFPTYWLMNGLDNSTGANWQLRYRSMHDLDTIINPSEDCGTTATMSQMSTWGYETNYGNVTLGSHDDYVVRNAANTSAGTITQSGNTVTGSGTSFTTDLIGGILTYADGTTTTITAYNSSTSLTVSTSRTIGSAQSYTAGGGEINCGRYFFFHVSIDASTTFGYPEDVSRGPTISDITLFFTADPSKRMRHGKTFTGGLQQPLDTPPAAP